MRKNRRSVKNQGWKRKNNQKVPTRLRQVITFETKKK